MLSIFIVFVLSSCNDKAIPNLQFSDGGALGQRIEKAKGGDLYVTDLSTIKKLVKLDPRQDAVSVTYNTHPLARYVEFKVCSENSNKCISEKTAFLRHDFLGLPSGKLEIAARACVEKKYSLDGIKCGPWASVIHTHSPTWHPNLAVLEELYADRRKFRESIGEFTNLIPTHFDTYLKELEQCQKNTDGQIEAQRKALMISAISKLSVEIIDLGVQEFLSDEGAVENMEASKDQESTLKQAEREVDKSGSNSPDVDDKKSEIKGLDALITEPSGFITTLESYLKSIKMFGDHLFPKNFSLQTVLLDKVFMFENKVDAAQFIGGTIVNLFYADKLIVPRCLAEQRFKSTNQAAMINLLELAKSKRIVESKILELEGAL